jgi:glycerol-3-phosphate cytidylyltransferase
MNIYSEETKSQIQSIKNKAQKYNHKKIGFTCSAFDLFHCGHVLMLEDAKSQCDILIVGLHTNPHIDRPNKNTPIQEYEERFIQVNGCKYVDEIIKYQTEDDLLNILKELNPDVRILGTDWYGKQYTGHELPIPIHWHYRNHNWSTTYLRERVYQRENKLRKEN